MKLLFYGINYAPELTGIGKYTGEMAAFYAQMGHSVEVITAPPYYPAWEIKEGYKNWWVTEVNQGVTVLRAPLYVPKEQSGLKRILQEFTFLASSYLYWIPRYFRKYDAIVCVSPPFHLGLLALPHKWLHGTTVVNHIQDLQVDAAKDLGLIKNKPLLSLLMSVEKWLLKRVSIISTISEGMRRKLKEKFADPAPVVMFPNWVDKEVIYPVSGDDSKRTEWGYKPDDKIVMYSGNLGSKQGLDAILRLADKNRDNPQTQFIIIGNGGTKAQLIAMAERMNLPNVRFLPLQPLEDLSAVLATADVHLVLQKKAAGDLVMPSKLTNILAVGGHALVTADAGTTLYDVVLEHRLGTLSPAEDERSLGVMLNKILSGQLDENATGAKSYADQYLDKESILTTYLKDITA